MKMKCQNEYLVIITAMIIIVSNDSLKQENLQKTQGQERGMHFLKFSM